MSRESTRILSVVLLGLSVVVGVGWWLVLIGHLSDFPRSHRLGAALLLTVFAVVQLLSWVAVTRLVSFAHGTGKDLKWLPLSACAFLLIANLLYFFTPVVGAPFALAISFIAFVAMRRGGPSVGLLT